MSTVSLVTLYMSTVTLYMSTSVHFCCTIKSVKWSANKQEREYRTCNNRNHAIYYVYRYMYKYKIYIHIQSHIQWTLRWKANGTYYYLCSLAVLICVLLLLFFCDHRTKRSLRSVAMHEVWKDCSALHREQERIKWNTHQKKNSSAHIHTQHHKRHTFKLNQIKFHVCIHSLIQSIYKRASSYIHS